MRTVIEAVDNKIVVTRERLSKRPSGDAASRRRQLKHGWQPSWQRCGQPSALHAVGDLLVTQFGEPDRELVFLPVGSTDEPVEIAAARELVANLKPVTELTAEATHCPDCKSVDQVTRNPLLVESCDHNDYPHLCAANRCINNFHLSLKNVRYINAHSVDEVLDVVAYSTVSPYFCPECGSVETQCEHLKATL